MHITCVTANNFLNSKVLDINNITKVHFFVCEIKKDKHDKKENTFTNKTEQSTIFWLLITFHLPAKEQIHH